MKFGAKQTNKCWKPGYVYILDYGDGETFKIGHTVNEPEIRLNQIAALPTVMPKVELVMAVYTSTNCERLEGLLHMYFDEQHVKGEWFKLDFVQLVEAYQCLGVFGGAELFKRWYELVPRDIDRLLEYRVVSPVLPAFKSTDLDIPNYFLGHRRLPRI